MEENPLQIPLFKLGRLIVTLRPQLIDAMGVEALKFIDDNFRMQGFQGSSFQPWTPRKAKQKGASRKILVQTGQLRRSFVKIDSATGTTISTDIPYAKIHNDGGAIRHPSRSVILSFKNAKGGRLKLGKTQTENQQRKISQLRRAAVGEHSVKMPQRQMIGNSPVLTERIEKILLRILTPAFNNL